MIPEEWEDWSRLPAPVVSLLQEVAVRLDDLVRGGEPEAIDLRALTAVTEEDLQQVRDLLGVGEVTATVQSLGTTELEETAFPGVWWATYCDADGAVQAERIELAWVPGLLVAGVPDVQAGLADLVDRLPEAPGGSDGEADAESGMPAIRWQED